MNETIRQALEKSKDELAHDPHARLELALACSRCAALLLIDSALLEVPTSDVNGGVWQCRIGEIDRKKLPSGADFPMRVAVTQAYRRLTGEDPIALFSGWGEHFTELERAVIEKRRLATPTEHQIRECNRHLNCDIADDVARKSGRISAEHCHDVDCPDCFGQ